MVLTKMKAMILCPFQFLEEMMKYSKEGKSSSSHVGIQNFPSDVCYDDAEHHELLSRKV